LETAAKCAAERGNFNIFDKLGVSTRLELALFAVNQSVPLRVIGGYAAG
jgi:hypothetical protein